MMQDRDTILYKKVKNLYEQAKTIWKGVLFEILLDPINPEPGEIAGRHIIDYQDCIADFKDEDEAGRDLSLDELFSEIERLQDYKNILKSALESIEILKEEFKDTYTVTLLRIIDHSNQVNNGNEEINEADSEFEIETDVEANDEFDVEWESSDSGVESPAEFQPHSPTYSEAESEVDYESDSGLQTESDFEPEWLLNWQPDSESDREVTPEPVNYQDYEPVPAEELNSESDENEEQNGTFEFDLEREEKLYFGLKYSNEEEEQQPSIVASGSSEMTSHFKLDCGEESRLKIINESKDDIIILGPNATISLPKSVHEAIPWKTATGATSALLLLTFGERALGNSAMSGYGPFKFQKVLFSSSAQLNALVLADICFIICSKYNVKEHEVRSMIETKCADIRIKLKRSF